MAGHISTSRANASIGGVQEIAGMRDSISYRESKHGVSGQTIFGSCGSYSSCNGQEEVTRFEGFEKVESYSHHADFGES